MQPQEAIAGDVSTPVEPTAHIPDQTELEIHTKKIPRQRHFLILFFFSFMWGVFGVDRMYMGLYGTGILKLLTFGGLGLWAMTDMIVVMTGTFKDKEGRVTLQFNEYKKFASRTILWFTIILAVVILASGISLVFSVVELGSSLQNGSIPGLDALTGGSDQSQINSILNGSN